jgi:hypothetical protein
MSTSKIKLQINGVNLTLPLETLVKTNWKGESITPFIRVRAKNAASLIKQYVKTKYPRIECSSKSDTYSGGDSVRIYLSTEDGNPVDSSIEKDINSFGNLFQEGNFNGMIDMYEYSDTKLTTDNGTPVEGGSKYVFVENRPKFGTVADVCRMLRDYQSGVYIGGVRTLTQSISEIMRYGISQSTVDKALKLI